MNWVRTWAIPLAVLFAGLLIAASIVFVGRWQISAIGYGYGGGEGTPDTDTQVVYRLDRWTGRIEICKLTDGNDQKRPPSSIGGKLPTADEFFKFVQGLPAPDFYYACPSRMF
jgi:hypothetical protein